jgi:hypothetical protein
MARKTVAQGYIALYLGRAGQADTVLILLFRKFFASAARGFSGFKLYPAFAADSGPAAGGVYVDSGKLGRLKQSGAGFDFDLPVDRLKGYGV